MDKFLTGLIVAGGILVLLPLLLILGTALGALAGWVVGIFFAETMATVMLAIFGATVEVWQLGAFLGFVGGYVRSIQTNNNG